MKLSELLQGFVSVGRSEEKDIHGLTLDSRQVKSGDLFFALSGYDKNGVNFIQHAIHRGAAAVVREPVFDNKAVSLEGAFDQAGNAVPVFAIKELRDKLGEIANRFYGKTGTTLPVVGITGTNGKTSCSHFLAQTLKLDDPCGVIGTIGWGVYGNLLPAQCTTPDVLTLHSMIHSMVEKGTKTVVMEVSSHALEQKRIDGIDVQVAVFTNLSRDHLDYHNDMTAYATAKRRLFELRSVKCAVINFDDEFGREISNHVHRDTQIIGFGFKQEFSPQLLGSNLVQTADGFNMDITSSWGSGSIKSGLLGEFNAANLLAVLGCNMALNKPFQQTLQRLERINSIAGRMQRLGGEKNRPIVVVDYAHTPDALKHVLQTLRSHNPSNLTIVFGCGGDRDRGKRALMGAVAEQFADRVILTDDNPRTENPQFIVGEILTGISNKNKIEIIHDRERAIEQALVNSDKHDIVVIAGKGHEDYQIFGTDKRYFSDAAVVESLLS